MVANREEITARGGASAGYGQSLGTEVSHRTDSGSSFSFSGSGSAGVQAGALYGITARNNEEGLTFGADFDIKVLGGVDVGFQVTVSRQDQEAIRRQMIQSGTQALAMSNNITQETLLQADRLTILLPTQYQEPAQRSLIQ